MTEVKILYEKGTQKLAMAINAHLNDGWKLHGPIFVGKSSFDGEITYNQMVTR